MSNRRLIKLDYLILLFILFSGLNECQSTPANPPIYSPVGSFEWRGTDYLEAREDYVYCVTPFGLEVWNFALPLYPEIVGRLYLENRASRLAVNDRFLAVAGDSGKLLIIKIDNQPQLTIAGEVGFEGELIDLATEGNRVLLLTNESLQVFEVSSSLAPTFAGLYYIPEGKAIAAENNRVYVATSFDFGSIHVLDISNTSTPILIGKLMNLTSIRDIAVRNDTVFASGTTVDLKIWDMSNAQNASQIASINFPSNTIELSLNGNYIVLGYDNLALRIFDVSNPSGPISRSIVGSTGWRRCISTSGSTAYIVDDSRFRTLDFTAPASPQWIFDSTAPSSPHYGGIASLTYAKGSIFVSRGLAGATEVRGWQTSTPYTFSEWKSPSCLSGDCGAASVCVTDKVIFTLFGGSNQAFLNIRNAATHEYLGELGFPWARDHISAINGDTLLLSGPGGGILVADFSTPTAPTILHTLRSSGTVLDIEDNGIAIVKPLWDSNAEIWDYSYWSAPALQSIYSDFTPWCFWENPPGPGGMQYVCNDVGPYSAAVDGNIVAVITLTDGLTLLEISDPVHPVPIGCLDSYFTKIKFHDKFIYSIRSTLIAYTVRTPILDIYDISIPTNPQLVCSLDCRSGINDFIFVDDYLVVATNSGILVFLENQSTGVSLPDSPLPQMSALSQNYPNPFNASTVIDYTVERNSQISIEVYNILGQKVRTLVNENMMPGKYQAEWDGNDANGNPVASGVYLYKIKSDNFAETRKMLLLK